MVKVLQSFSDRVSHTLQFAIVSWAALDTQMVFDGDELKRGHL